MKNYRLFALGPGGGTLAAAARFGRITPAYALVYTEGAAPEQSVQIDETELDRLSSGDRDWLLGCNLALLEEDAKAREAEIAQRIGEQIERLEAALERARRENGESDGGSEPEHGTE